jgi:hypothetical protein
MESEKKRKKITDRIRLQVLQQDNYTCTTCGRSPVTHPGLALEVDHKVPFSKGGADHISNFKTSCMGCNRGKGNDERFNRTLKNDIDAILNCINPQILINLNSHGAVNVIANQEDYAKIFEKNSLGFCYLIEIIPNTLMGFGVGKNLGLYTINDSGGSKINFNIKNIVNK